MKVILTEKVNSLGAIGDIVNVSNGYARNFLMPQKKAVIASDARKKELENNKRALAGKIKKEANGAGELKSKIDGMTLTFVKQVSSNSKIFGAITSMVISNELKAQGFEVEKRVISLAKPIKEIGNFQASVKLFSGVQANLNIEVKMDPKQITENKEREASLKKEKEEAKLKMAESKTEEDQPKKEMTEEERLDKEARELLRS